MFGDTVSEIQKYDTVPLDEVFDKPQGGEWGTDDDAGTGTPVLRTTNFTDGGYADVEDVVRLFEGEGLDDIVKKRELSQRDH